MITTQQHWIYHERQEAQLCGQHALNNLVQQNAFSPSYLAEIAFQLDQMELNFMSQNNEGGVSSKDYLKRMAEGSGNVDESGNFSIEVLRSALLSGFNLALPHLKQQGVGDKNDVTELDGFVSRRVSIVDVCLYCDILCSTRLCHRYIPHLQHFSMADLQP